MTLYKYIAGMQELLFIGNEYGKNHDIVFNVNNTVYVFQTKGNKNLQPIFNAG